MASVYSTPPHILPVTLRQLKLAVGRLASATLAPTADSCAVVWYVDGDWQDAAHLPNREAALAWGGGARDAHGTAQKFEVRESPFWFNTAHVVMKEASPSSFRDTRHRVWSQSA